MLLALFWSTAVVHGQDARAPACDIPAFAQTLQAAAQPAPPARAYWLSASLLKWPGMAAGAPYALYASGSGSIVAAPGAAVVGADARIALRVSTLELPQAVTSRFAYTGDGVVLTLADAAPDRIKSLLRQQLVLVQEDAKGKVLATASLQAPAALDEAYAAADALADLGVVVSGTQTRFKLWAPTATAVSVCVYVNGRDPAIGHYDLQADPTTGAWSASREADLSGQYYTYLVDVFVPGTGMVRNRVTDPYSISLNADSKRSYIADLSSDALKPDGWETTPGPIKVQAQTDMVIYELHVRDFSINDPSVQAAHRGKYLAFTDRGSNGMQHLQALSAAGLTDIHLLPVFDFASVPEAGCVTPAIRNASPAGDAQQAVVAVHAREDCFNWGYDPYHFNAAEGSYASDAGDGGKRILEFRQMVQALHRTGLRVGMDVVYNHTTTSGQQASSVLDRIVPGYYQRLDRNGVVERSTCCDNTATEHRMMAKLMIDSVVLWAQQYKIDSFRFDLMGHQPRAAMETLRARVDAATGRQVNLIGEGWNFGEIADGARFVQASQLSLNGSGIGTFSDRARDAMRGGGPADSGDALVAQQGWINGLVYDPNASANPQRPPSDLMRAADLVRVGLAGSLRDYVIVPYTGVAGTLEGIDYSGQPAGYVSQPAEVVNYVENHDNQTLFDINAYKLPLATSREDRARVQMLGMAINAFSQGVAYFHAGIDTLRSKSMDRNSFDSGDWFNRLDWRYRDNYFGTGLPPKGDNGRDYALIAPRLSDPGIKPTAREIGLARDMFRDLLRIRASSTLFRMRSADDIKQRLRFYDTGAAQNPVLIAGHLDGNGYAGAGYAEVLYLVNVDKTAQTLLLPTQAGKAYVLHPVHRARNAADRRPAREARYDAASGRFTIPPRTAVVYVVATGTEAAASNAAPPAAAIETLQWEAKAFAPEKIKVEVHLPAGYDAYAAARYPVLYVNDGQDMDAVAMDDLLRQLRRDGAIEPVIVVAIDMLRDRMGTYGLSDRKAARSVVGTSRFGPIGSQAHAYSEWVARELVPYIDAHYRTRPSADARTVLGWSLGALNAFNLGWQYPDVFGRVGAFSPSFWIASDRSDDRAAQRTRLAQTMVAAGPKRDGAKIWLAVGDKEETDDRDGDGINDALDDTRDLIEALALHGYSIDDDAAAAPSTQADASLYLLKGGNHNQASWKRMLPAFLTWAYGTRPDGVP